ncbi:peptidoglycan-binding domain-containing protein [Lentzea sp. NPDC005914]|uniref:peptidoglycan-binding domain-containing protein n=1 Tax=Lentzea sp. NPDC005914 TaxID=3154572 RepID=UPI0034113F23
MRGIASRRTLVVCGGVLIVVVAVVGALGLGGNGPDAAENPAQSTGAAVEITKGTLTNATTVSGELNHGTETPIALKATGTVTWLPAEGTVVGRGEPLLRVDDRPVVLLFGDLPAYRDLAEATAPPAPPAAPKAEGGTPPPAPASPVQPFTGRDVEQFESNLSKLGYGGFTVDRTFTAQTTTAVKRWQKDLGEPQSGAVGAGDVFYAAGPLRVAKVLGRLGAPATGDLLSYTGTTRSVRVKVPASEAGWAAAGTPVDVTLPDGKAVAGTVTSTGQVQAPDAAQPASGDAPPPSVQVVVDIQDQSALGTLDRSPVAVRHVVEKREDVLSVPVAALLALAEGGYGLEVLDGAATRIVPVKTGLFADGRVEVSGTGVEQGLHVRLPG